MIPVKADQSPYARAARELIALGYHPIPIMPGEKAPGEYRSGRWWRMSKWQRFRDQAPSQFEVGLWERNFPEANIGLVLGSMAGADRLIAVDIDTIDHDEFDMIVSALPWTPMVKKGSKGETRFYRAPKEVKSKPYDKIEGEGRRRLVDVLSGFDTRQTVCPPSIHPETHQPYTWTSGPVAAADLPLFDLDALEKLEDTLSQIGWDPNATRLRPPADTPTAVQRHAQPVAHDEDDYFTETKVAALGNLDAWVPDLDLYGCRRARGGFEAVATWRTSSTGQPLEKRKRNLSIQANGITDFGTSQGYSAIDLVMAAKDWDRSEATGWLRDRLGLGDSQIVINLQPRALAVVEPDIKPDIEAVSTELPDELTRIPGLLGELTDWIANSARRPQRGLSLGAALTIVGTAAGRKYAGPTRSGTHLYILGLARTSAGKDHPLKMVSRVLTQCNMTHHLGPSQFMSLSAVVNRLTRAPLTLSPMDEFGAFLARINNRRASTHEQAISGILRTAWSASFDTLNPPEWAGRAAEPIHCPAFSIYGVSTPEEFYNSLAGGDVHNGFLNRFMLISTKKRPPERDPKVDAFNVPDGIRTAMLRIYGSGSALMVASMHNGQADGPAITADWADDAAKAVYAEFSKYLEDREADAEFLARTAEMAVRLAAIRAIGIRHDAPRVTVADMEWGRDLALWSAERMKAETDDYLADTQNQADAQRVLRIIKDRGRTQHGDLVRAMQHRIKARDLKDLLSGLADGAQIAIEVERPPGGGPEKRWYTPR